MLNDMEIMRLFGVPNTTSRDWKKREKEDWRYKVYIFLKNQNKETIEKFFSAMSEIEGDDKKADGS